MTGGLLLTSCSETESTSEVRNLKVEHLTNPLGLDVEKPRFSWIYENSSRGAEQSAYRIMVAKDPGNLENGTGSHWDSGKVMSSKTLNIEYGGEPLESGEKYYWKVRVWDRDGNPKSWSEIQSFQMGLLHPDDWLAEWITTIDSTISSPLLRNDFVIEKEIESATAFVTGVGYYEFYLNGEKVGDHVLDPGLTDFRDRILYETYDVTDHLRVGENAIGFGWGTGLFGSKRKKAGGPGTG